MLANVNLILSALLMSSAVSANNQGRNAETISHVARAVERIDDKLANAIPTPQEAAALDPAVDPALAAAAPPPVDPATAVPPPAGAVPPPAGDVPPPVDPAAVNGTAPAGKATKGKKAKATGAAAAKKAKATGAAGVGAVDPAAQAANPPPAGAIVDGAAGNQTAKAGKKAKGAKVNKGAKVAKDANNQGGAAAVAAGKFGKEEKNDCSPVR